jgi:hypothetical protein
VKGGRQDVDYRFRGGTVDPNAISAQRAAQDAFGKQRSGGLQLASKNAHIDAAMGDVVVVENTSTATGARPTIRLPKLTAGATSKTVTVTFGKKSTTAEYYVTGVDAVNGGTAGALTAMTITSPVRIHIYMALSDGYGWRHYALSS